MGEYEKRRDKMLTYYPEVARVGNLALALSRAFAEVGSSLSAYSPVPPEKPIWSPFSDHPDAPGTTVPEFARVKVGDQTCQVTIGWFEVPLGSFSLEFFKAFMTDDLAEWQGSIDTSELGKTAQTISRVYEHHAEIGEVAHTFGLDFHAPPPPREDPAAVRRFMKRVLEKFDEPARGELELLVERFAESRRRGEEPDPSDVERLTAVSDELRKRRFGT